MVEAVYGSRQRTDLRQSLRKLKLEAWNRNKEDARAWLALNMVTEARKIAGMADAWQLPVAPHDCTGPVNLFACLQLCAATPNAMIMETVRRFCEGYYREVVAEPVSVSCA